ncbi:c-type cytochrome, partial [Verrucomicrobiales bacterium]|nr:c-type cytochrome [Verrucomicrobiales bacterium]
MNWTSCATGSGGFLAIMSLCVTQLVAQTPPVKEGISNAEIDPTDLKEQATRVMNTYCVSCHGSDKQKGDVQLNTLESIDAVDRQELFRKVQEVIRLAEMPPEKAKQPNEADRKILLQWLNSQLTGKAAEALAEKLRRFEYGNVISHENLFSGKYAEAPGYTPDRRWLISEFIFNEKINRLLNYHPTRTIYGTAQSVKGDSGVHWSPKTERGNKFRRTITNPYLLPEKVGVRYSSHKRLTTGHLLTMVGNAKRVAGHMSSEAIMKAHYPAMYAMMKTELDHRDTLRSRERFLRTYPFMERLLNDIYGKEHKELFSKLVRKEIPYPGPPKHSTNGIQKRHDNLDFLDRFNHEDIRAILQGIATYKQTDFKVDEN